MARLEAYRIGPEDAAFSFAQRLARENGWDVPTAERAIGEYKRFCYLAMTAGHPVTPSDAVDQVWHLHLTFTQDYWQRFCPEVLGRPLHHGPTKGGAAERTRYYDQYAATLKSYETAFGEVPPADLWPAARRRFVDDPKAFRVNPSDVLILSRKRVKVVAVVALVLGAAFAAIWWGK
ncbi:glycine-rich domain-containing protein [Sphingomicrobium aestuariivivum]|uniref:glycine-rich domain-containing protein n=1 Tax=Sphingomicrobium aestuariivivum TaxID=1582356 RepID=UPI001FD6E463|nr:hypothetical protein [Sphingomicrobium aestuariivivum]MCJ8189971.1 hypothetical protein [Sphingomicrobium aestuariivivum]